MYGIRFLVVDTLVRAGMRAGKVAAPLPKAEVSIQLIHRRSRGGSLGGEAKLSRRFHHFEPFCRICAVVCVRVLSSSSDALQNRSTLLLAREKAEMQHSASIPPGAYLFRHAGHHFHPEGA